MDNRKTGTLIAIRRQELELTQKELAGRLHVSDRAVSKWERGAGFPDVSLLEPLADALELSVLELIHGQREIPEERPSPEAERSVREVTRELGTRFMKALRRYRRALVALAALLVCGLMGFLILWLSPFQVFVNETREVSVAEALKVCPFAIITSDDFKLSRQLLNDPNIGGLLTGNDTVSGDEFTEISDELADRYREMAFIEEEPADRIHIEVLYDRKIIMVNYGNEQWTRSCSLSIVHDGSMIYKVACTREESDGSGPPGEIVGGLVENQNNVYFTVSREKRDLLYFLNE